jgi:hypothetical protein
MAFSESLDGTIVHSLYRLYGGCHSVAGVRHCTHIINSPEEIDRAVEIVNGMAGLWMSSGH